MNTDIVSEQNYNNRYIWYPNKAGYYVLIAMLVMLLTGIPVTGHADWKSIREPVWAGRFYPAQKIELQKVIQEFVRLAESTRTTLPEGKDLKALVIPHAGYIYSGWTAAHAARLLQGADFTKVILMAPDHRVGFTGGAISDVRTYRTPLGLIPVHAEAHLLRKKHALFHASHASDAGEHAVEVVLPFLQYFLPEFHLIPIVVGRCDPHRFVDAMLPLLSGETLLVVSSDLSHYRTYADAVKHDRETLKMILSLDHAGLLSRDNAACGKMPLAILMHIAERKSWIPVFLHYSNSGDTAGGHDRVVGYTAIAFYGDRMTARSSPASPGFSLEQGRLLLKLARVSIEKQFQPQNQTDALAFIKCLDQITEFRNSCGTFVTLKKNGRLRGCIGNLTDSLTIRDGIQQNAVRAAFHDPRFPPLQADDLESLRIEVSILTTPEPLPYHDGSDLVSKLTVNLDGVIIRKDDAGATFLPQVWEQLPTPEVFLSRLCRKAGLPADAWMTTKLDVMTYRVQSFHE